MWDLLFSHKRNWINVSSTLNYAMPQDRRGRQESETINLLSNNLIEGLYLFLLRNNIKYASSTNLLIIWFKTSKNYVCQHVQAILR